jgi:WS/DGAT/MGAT family acyltransferase
VADQGAAEQVRMSGERAGATEHMSDLESLMWSLDADPVLSSTFANITWFDRLPDRTVLRRRLWRATRAVPRLRRRVVEGFGPTTPHWEDDPAFDLDHHLRWLELPAGATDADVRALAVSLAATPFDRRRPLWEFTVIGLADGRAAMVQKIHHTITDGKGGIKMSLEFVDLERDAPQPAPLDDGPPPVADRSPWVGALDAVNDLARRPASAARRIVDVAAEWARDPLHVASILAALPAETAATTRSIVRQVGVVDSHRSPIWTERSLDRTLETFDISLVDAKAAAAELGCSVNDLFVSAAAGGAGAYHRRLGVGVDELRMSMPVSARTERTAGGNAFTPTRVLVPVGPDARARTREIHERLAVTKSERAMNLMGSLSGLATLLPQPVLVRLARQQVLTVDFATSNVRAAPFDLYIAGALLTANYPVGPIAGTAWNLTTMSYRGVLHLGLHADRAAVADPAQLRADIEASFAELLQLGGRGRGRRRRGATR